jgi:UDPglucose 6-dehydrogenase
MKIGIVGNGFVGRATQIFAKNFFAKDNAERFEVLPDTVTTPAKPKSIRTYSAIPSSDESSASSSSNGNGGGWTPPFFKRLLFKPIEVYIYDIRPEACQPPGMTLEQLDRECDLVFFCLPTPLNHDGSCYTKILEDAIARCSNPFKIIRSTIPVGFAAKHGCYFMPEFLTEANWESDFRKTREWVIGIPNSAAATPAAAPDDPSNTLNHTVIQLQHDDFKTRITKLIKRSYKNSAIESPIVVFCDTNEAEMLKLMKNCFLSAKVSLMNEFYDFCAATHTDYNTVTGLAKKDARMGTSHFQVPGPDGNRGFGGTCFPKDTHSLYCQMNAHGVQPHIYPAILARNDTIDRPEREWSRDVWRTTIPLPTPQSKVVVVFNDTASITPSSASLYLADIIRTNLAKNNVVIEVSRDLLENNIIHPNTATATVTATATANHIIHHCDRNNPGAPLFFPRVDECYYIPHSSHTAYETMREVSCVIDLWNNHKEMTLYVIKTQTNHLQSEELCRITSGGESGLNNESDTEGFESDADTYTPSMNSMPLDYCKIIQEYYHATYNTKNSDRLLIIMF